MDPRGLFICATKFKKIMKRGPIGTLENHRISRSGERLFIVCHRFGPVLRNHRNARRRKRRHRKPDALAKTRTNNSIARYTHSSRHRSRRRSLVHRAPLSPFARSLAFVTNPDRHSPAPSVVAHLDKLVSIRVELIGIVHHAVGAAGDAFGRRNGIRSGTSGDATGRRSVSGAVSAPKVKVGLGGVCLGRASRASPPRRRRRPGPR